MSESTSVVSQNSGQMEHAMSVEGVMAQVRAIQDLMRQAMIKDEHYGIIPGCVKPSLLKPGAEKLGMMFRLSPSYTITRREHGNNHVEFEVTCRLTHIKTGEIWGEGVGSCSTLETKFRYRKAEQTCPKCGKPTIIKGKKEYGGGWICFAKKGGCGAKFQDGDGEIENQNMGRIEHSDPADYYNTVLKMAKKRAQVDAILTATAASDIFTQDVEEMVDNGVIDVPVTESKANIPPPPMKKEPQTYDVTPEPTISEIEYQMTRNANVPRPQPQPETPQAEHNESTVDGLRDAIRDLAATHFPNENAMALWLKTLTSNEEKGFRGIDSLDASKSFNQLKFIMGSLRRTIAQKKGAS
jgi:hypothetical protein